MLPLHREPDEIGKALPLERLRDIAGAPRAFEIRIAGRESERTNAPAPESPLAPSEPTGSTDRAVADGASRGAPEPPSLAAEPLAAAAAVPSWIR